MTILSCKPCGWEAKFRDTEQDAEFAQRVWREHQRTRHGIEVSIDRGVSIEDPLGQTAIPDWAAPGEVVYELHCTTSGYRTMKRIQTRVAHVTRDVVVLANGVRYSMSELAATPPHSAFHRDDPESASRYYLLVGPDDPRSES